MIEKLFNPHSAVVVGSPRESLTANLLERLAQSACENIYLVNEGAEGYIGLPGFSAATKIGRPLDVAVIAVPPGRLCSALADVGEAGVRIAILLGRAKSAQELQGVHDICQKYRIRYIGPDSDGVINSGERFYATLQPVPLPGKIAVVTQSGSIGGLFLAQALQEHVGISKFVSYSHGGDLNEMDFLEYLKDDSDTEAVALYLENVRDGRKLISVLYEVTRVKPVVVLKSGRSASGQKAACAHNGTISGADLIYDAAFLTSGALRVDTGLQLFDACRGLVTLPRLGGRRLAVVSNSSGLGVMAADRAEQLKLQLVSPSKPCKQLLEGFLPPEAAVDNPIDITEAGSGNDYRRVLNYVLPQNDAALAIFAGLPQQSAKKIAQGIAAAAKNTHKPLAAVLTQGEEMEQAYHLLQHSGVLVFPTVERAVFTLSKLAQYDDMQEIEANFPQSPHSVGKLNQLRRSMEDFYAHHQEPLPDQLALQLLAQSGITVPPYEAVETVEKVRAASERIGYPQVIEINAPQLLDRRASGGTIFDVMDADSAQAAFKHLKMLADRLEIDFQGVLIYPLLPDGEELMLSLSRDDQFGPIIALGMGGPNTEVINDVVFRIAPVDLKEAYEMLAGLRYYPALCGRAGRSGIDLDAVAETIVVFSQFPFLYPDLEEAEINPLYAYADGVVVVDIRLTSQK